MPKYQIGLCQRDNTVEEMDLELPGLRDLRTQMSAFAGQLLKDRPEAIWGDEDWRIEAKDSSGLTLYLLVVFAGRSPAMAHANEEDAKP